MKYVYALITAFVLSIGVANAGVYENVFAGHYNDTNGNPADVKTLVSQCGDSTSSYGWTAAAATSPTLAFIGREAIHGNTLLLGIENLKAHYNGVHALAAVALDYGIKSQQFDVCAREHGYVLTDFTSDVVNKSFTFGTK